MEVTIRHQQFVYKNIHLNFFLFIFLGGLGSSVHLAENPLNSQELNQEGLMLTSTCLEKSSEKMFSLWQNIFNGVFETSDKSMETTSAGLRDRLTNLIGESAVGATNGIAHMGHHYAMAHAASKLNLPALQKQEGLSGNANLAHI